MAQSQIQKHRSRHVVEARLAQARAEQLDAPPTSARHKILTEVIDGLLDELVLVLARC